MLYFAKTGMVQLLEDVSAHIHNVSTLGQAKSLIKLFTKTRRQMRDVREMGPQSGLILNHTTDLAPLGSHLFRQADQPQQTKCVTRYIAQGVQLSLGI